jgi:hypothetical protein
MGKRGDPNSKSPAEKTKKGPLGNENNRGEKSGRKTLGIEKSTKEGSWKA